MLGCVGSSGLWSKVTKKLTSALFMMDAQLTLEQKLHIVWEMKCFRKACKQGLMPPPIVKPPWWQSLSKDEEERVISQMKILIRENRGMEKNDKY